MDRKTLAWAAAVLCVAVAFGAFGAHGLKSRVGPEAVAQWQTGVQYQFYHGLGLFGLALLGGRLPAQRSRLIRALLLAGIFLFSGSIYLLATRDILGTQGLTMVLGPITPLGGLCFIAAWVVLFMTALRTTDER